MASEGMSALSLLYVVSVVKGEGPRSWMFRGTGISTGIEDSSGMAFLHLHLVTVLSHSAAPSTLFFILHEEIRITLQLILIRLFACKKSIHSRLHSQGILHF